MFIQHLLGTVSTISLAKTRVHVFSESEYMNPTNDSPYVPTTPQLKREALLWVDPVRIIRLSDLWQYRSGKKQEKNK